MYFLSVNQLQTLSPQQQDTQILMFLFVKTDMLLNLFEMLLISMRLQRSFHGYCATDMQ